MTLLAIASIAAMTACQSTRENNNVSQENIVVQQPQKNLSMAMPNAIIYKTKADYSNLVPIMMDDTKTSVVSYPDPVDVKSVKKPTLLENGFLLDNFGIGKNVVYTDYTFEEYAALEKVPELDEIMQHIIDKEPLVAYYVSTPEFKQTPQYRTAETINKDIINGLKGFEAVIKE